MTARQELLRLARIGQKCLDGALRGGRRQPIRDRHMALESQRRRVQTFLSPSALKTDIGKSHGLKRRAAIYAVDRGLKIIRAASGELHGPDVVRRIDVPRGPHGQSKQADGAN